jgi:hypothetical protein
MMTSTPAEDREQDRANSKTGTKSKSSSLEKELQEWEVESTKDGQDSQGKG